MKSARENVRGAGLEDRITIRNQDVTALDDVDTYDLAWVPTFFLPETVLTTLLPKIVRSLRPGGWVALGMFATAPNPLSEAITDLRTIRGGGCVLGPERGTELLGQAGCSTIRVLDRTGPAPAEFVIGRRPPS